jgi:YtoQ family protein
MAQRFRAGRNSDSTAANFDARHLTTAFANGMVKLFNIEPCKISTPPWTAADKQEFEMNWTVYLSGEIHSDWRQQIIDGARALDLPIDFTSAITDHDASDAAGDMLEPESGGYWRDHKSSGVNGIRTRTLLGKCDLAVVRFGDRYKQWNAAFDAGYCAALGKPYITLHDADIVHALKEVDAAAMAWAQTPAQVVQILQYVTAD